MLHGEASSNTWRPLVNVIVIVILPGDTCPEELPTPGVGKTRTSVKGLIRMADSIQHTNPVDSSILTLYGKKIKVPKGQTMPPAPHS